MEPSTDGKFPETEWTLIRRLRSSDNATAKRALEDLCNQYHYPLYCCIRRQGLNHHDAEDALQEFLAKLLRNESFEKADREKGRLRALLGTALQRFLSNWHRNLHRRPNLTQGDGGIAGNGGSSASRYEREKPIDSDTPALIFERKWAQELLLHVLTRFGEDYARREKSDLFKAFKPILMRGGSLRGENVAALANSLGMKETTLRVAYLRFHRDYRTALEAEVRQTVHSEEEVQEEISYLRSLFDGK
jgi:RNA polymerase sigma-70 factor (ECF subfamily)